MKPSFTILLSKKSFYKFQFSFQSFEIITPLSSVKLPLRKSSKKFLNPRIDQVYTLAFSEKSQSINKNPSQLSKWRRKKRRNKLNRFYFPNHFEINFKTFNIFHLGFFDARSMSLAFPFKLHLKSTVTRISR